MSQHCVSHSLGDGVQGHSSTPVGAGCCKGWLPGTPPHFWVPGLRIHLSLPRRAGRSAAPVLGPGGEVGPPVGLRVGVRGAEHAQGDLAASSRRPNSAWLPPPRSPPGLELPPGPRVLRALSALAHGPPRPACHAAALY